MRALIVYESLYGNTHIIANSIAEGLRDKACDVLIVPVTRATAEMARDTDPAPAFVAATLAELLLAP